MSLNKITTCLWFDGRAEEAANHYIAIFKNSEITQIQRDTDAGKEAPGGDTGTAKVVAFKLDGRPFIGLNGGPYFKFNEAISFQVECTDQAEIDSYWERLGEGGDESKQRCGWLVDKFGVSWQVIPKQLKEFLGGPDKEGAARATSEMMRMKKLDIAALKKAYDGET
ncbi:3-demethylubiquinone-9 3-methyltransferase-domain-containing protein [Phialemonium atrogriseum]|uniref:3-demethylubiquinone-9 3-methyltransferase-domain-containing protein n=1 Tax=Phialemonium atrogriseum TaxID=1093897 RepID=A0AAJ0BZU9_9PEZI|nr:3-demethylubiquinone-9 3-methyltransferase-domain-containing protein [Phialemonium atrogriseum]KAK1767529.1 3-demethylubiquinone-9 3-methyltransferase-domain-containing protein [Phialemonium atrogriseum]